MPGIEANDGNTAAAEIQRQPVGELAGLKANADGRRSESLYCRGDRFRGRGTLAAPDHGAFVVDDANGGRFERHVEADILLLIHDALRGSVHPRGGYRLPPAPRDYAMSRRGRPSADARASRVAR